MAAAARVAMVSAPDRGFGCADGLPRLEHGAVQQRIAEGATVPAVRWMGSASRCGAEPGNS